MSVSNMSLSAVNTNKGNVTVVSYHTTLEISNSLDKLLPQKYKKSSNQQFPKPSCSFAFQANIPVQRHRLFSVFAASFVIKPTISSRQLCMDRPAVGNMIAAKRSYKSPDITELDVEVRREIRYTTPLDPKTMEKWRFLNPQHMGCDP